MSRLKIAVLFGGCSPEYGVSLQSAAAVLRHMAQSRYEPVMVGISQAGDWFHYTGPVDSIESDTWHNAETCVPAVMRPDRSAPALLVLGPEGMQKVRLAKTAGPVRRINSWPQGAPPISRQRLKFFCWGIDSGRILS